MRGLVEIYTGDGKGKTTAAVGLSLRALGNGFRVLFVQFMKGSPSGEVKMLETAGATVMRSENFKKFTFEMTKEELEEAKKSENLLFLKAKDLAKDFDVAVFDEIFPAVSTNILNKKDIISLIKERPENTELVLTGRDAIDEALVAADYVSKIEAVKHPYNKGISARKGIEF